MILKRDFWACPFLIILVLGMPIVWDGLVFSARASETESDDSWEIPYRRRFSQTPAATLVEADWQDLSAVQKLVAAGADGNEIYEEEDWSDLSWHTKCVLLEVIREGTPEVVECLLTHGGDVRKKVPYSESCLEIAAQRGNLRIFQLLVEHGGCELLHSRDHLGNTLLFETTSPEIARFLVENGLDVYAMNFFGETAFHHIANSFPRSQKVLEFYLDEMGMDVNYADAKGESILWQTFYRNDLKDFLFARNIDVHHRNLRGETVLFRAAERVRDAIPFFESMVKKGSDLNIRANDGRTLLHEAVRVGNLGLVQYLLEKGLRVDTATMDGKIPIDYARNLDIVIYLLKNGSEIPVKWAASLVYHENIWTYLIENQYLSADDLWMELMESEWRKQATREAEWQMRMLSELGANVNAVDSNGASIIWFYPDNPRWYELCAELGADLQQGIPRSEDDPLFRNYYYTAPKTLLEHAVANGWGGNVECIAILVKMGINELDAIPHHFYWINRDPEVLEKLGVKRVFRRGVMDCSRWNERQRSFSFHFAGIIRNRPFFEYLVDNGWDLNGNIHGEPPLCRAVGNRNYEVTKILLENGAYVNGTGESGEFPIILARQWGDEEIVSLLLEFGAYDISLEEWKAIREEHTRAMLEK
ncbi:MAG: ankyrin repeat domain-containing protein [Planctomycetia bacterium]|nr:ankyrin repeat domain-containing protein [Planctomycetia bacterium]